MQPNDQDLRATAYHEAGHAIMAYIHGIEVDVISLAGSFHHAASTAGEVIHFAKDAPLPERIQIVLAGRVAEKWVNPQAHLNGSDLEKYNKLLREWCKKIGWPSGNEQFQAWIDATSDITDRWLQSFRPWVEAVAEELLRRRVLSGEEITKLILDHQDKAYDANQPEEEAA